MSDGFPSYIMPPMPWSCPPAAGASGSGMSVTSAEVVKIIAAIDVASGERVWKGGRYGNGQLLLLPDQDLLLVISERGELALVRATAERFEEVARIQALSGKTWNHPIVADGVVYLRNAEEAAAYRLPVPAGAPVS